jgi:hypothetical protein
VPLSVKFNAPVEAKGDNVAVNVNDVPAVIGELAEAPNVVVVEIVLTPVTLTLLLVLPVFTPISPE